MYGIFSGNNGKPVVKSHYRVIKKDGGRQNFVETQLVKTWGDDLATAAAAYISTNNAELTDTIFQLTGKRDVETIVRDLVLDTHTSTLEHSGVTFLICADMSTLVQILRHRIASPNMESDRYQVPKAPAYYIPEDWPAELQEELDDASRDAIERWKRAKVTLVEHYKSKGFSDRSARRRANETSRLFAPHNKMAKLMLSINWRSLFNFFDQRLSDHAQPEITAVASSMLSTLEGLDQFKGIIAAYKESLEYKDVSVLILSETRNLPREDRHKVLNEISRTILDICLAYQTTAAANRTS